MLVWPQPQAKAVLRFYREFSVSAADALRLDAILGSSPDGPILAIIVCWCGGIAAGEQAIAPLRAFGPPVADTVATVPYRVIQGLLESLGYAPGQYHYWKSSFFKELSDDAVDALVDGYLPVPSPMCAVAIEHLGGAIGRSTPDATAFSHRHAQHSFLAVGAAAEAPAPNALHAWAQRVADSAAPFLEEGVYVNYLAGDEGERRVRAAYGAHYKRLAAIKRQYDPSNLFRMNQNIAPA
jgi:FAD/FMN-containing dehydrogenase